MTKFIISERQYSLLKELNIPSGKYNADPLNDFFNLFHPSNSFFSEKKMSKLVRNYLENIVGLDTSKISNEKIYEYISKIAWSEKVKGIPKTFYNIGVVSGLSYFLAKNFFGLKKTTYGLVYHLENSTSTITYWFFDPEIKDFIGRISVTDNENYPSPSYQIAISSVDPVFIGRGYGTKMYLTILDDCEYLISDTLLYKDSLNIWTNVLPKYANVWARIGDTFSPIKKKFVNPENVKYYVASTKHNDIG
jgi:hypothetical protein